MSFGLALRTEGAPKDCPNMLSVMDSLSTRDLRIEHRLRDGASIQLRPVGPGDRERLQEGFTALSEKTRFQRFFRRVRRLTEEDVDYLTQVDQIDHVAWAALDASDPGERGLGLARFVRESVNPHVAEVAFVVIDSHHRRGIGTALLAVLLAHAEQVDVTALRAVVRPDNDPVLVWLRNLGAEETTEEGLVHEFIIRVGRPISGTRKARELDRLRRMFRVRFKRPRWRGLRIVGSRRPIEGDSA